MKTSKKNHNKTIIILGILFVLGALVIVNFKKISEEWDWLTLKPQQMLNVPLINQLPDLPNGCEVTALAMLFKYDKINVTKEELATNITHVASYSADGRYRGNPNIGFVGYMNQKNAGWCVYNQPLYNVARRYTQRIQNVTGIDFIQIIHLVSTGHPVMIITTLKFKTVNDMQTWHTLQGNVHVTPSSHACVITGYNKAKKIVYVNDPYGFKNRPVSWQGIAASYRQQGQQALYLK